MKSSELSITTGHVVRDHHFADSQSGKVKEKSCEDLRSVKLRKDHIR
jgi:hypothetical protein